MGFLQFAAMILMGLPLLKDAELATALLFISNLGIAFSDVIVDALMIIQARRFPEFGAEELNSFAWTWMAFGGISSSLIAAFLTQNYEPRFCFLISSFFGLFVVIVATRLDVHLEKDENTTIDNSSRNCWSDVKRNFSEIGQAFMIREYTSMIIYILLWGLFVPSFGTFGYYFFLNVIGISKFMYAMLIVIGFFCLLIGARIYQSCMN